MFAGIMLEVPQRYGVRNPLFEEAVVEGTCLTIPKGKKLIVSLQTFTLPTADSWYRKPSPRLCPGLY